MLCRSVPAHGRAHPARPAGRVDQVRHAAREQLRTGADQIKIMAGGGAASPTDPLDATQFTLEEIAAAVYEAKVVKKPVMANVYIPEGIKNCVDAGVRSIEHGNFLDEESAFMMKEKGMFLVPTLSAYDIMSRLGKEQGNSQVVIDKINKFLIPFLIIIKTIPNPSLLYFRSRRNAFRCFKNEVLPQTWW